MKIRWSILLAVACAASALGATNPAGATSTSTCQSRHVAPKAGFNPLKASDAQLQAEDFPARPTKPELLAVWKSYASKYAHAQLVTPCGSSMPAPSVAEQTAATGTVGTNDHWSGYIVNHGAYTDVQTTFGVPRVTGSSTNDSAVMWAGVDLGSASHPLVQGGSVSTPGHGSYLFWEVTPPNKQVNLFQVGKDSQGRPLYLTADVTGDFIDVHVRFNPTGAGFTIKITDESKPWPSLVASGTVLDAKTHKPAAVTPDGHAEVIAERKVVGATNYGLANFTVQEFFENRAAAPGVGWRNFTQLSHAAVIMTNTAKTHWDAVPEALDGAGDFGVDWLKAN